MHTKRFTFLCSEQERKLVTAIAQRHNRSQGDAMRCLIKVAAQELKLKFDIISQPGIAAKEDVHYER